MADHMSQLDNTLIKKIGTHWVYRNKDGTIQKIGTHWVYS